MITALITFGGIAFWILAALFTLIITYSVSKADSWIRPAIWTVAAVGATVAFTDIPLPLFTLENVVVAATTWFAVGVIWAFGKWVLLVFQIRDYVRKEISSLPRDGHESQEAYEYEVDRAIARIAYHMFKPNDANYTLTLPPKAGEFHTRISTWITFWPASMLADLSGDLIAPAFDFVWKLGSKLATAVAGTFSAVSKRIYEG